MTTERNRFRGNGNSDGNKRVLSDTKARLGKKLSNLLFQGIKQKKDIEGDNAINNQVIDTIDAVLQFRDSFLRSHHTVEELSGLDRICQLAEKSNQYRQQLCQYMANRHQQQQRKPIVR